MSNRKRNKVIEEFIEIYKSENCLWRIKSKDYHNRFKKEAAYAKLVQKLKELEPDTNKESVIKSSPLRYECDETFPDECKFAARAEGE